MLFYRTIFMIIIFSIFSSIFAAEYKPPVKNNLEQFVGQYPGKYVISIETSGSPVLLYGTIAEIRLFSIGANSIDVASLPEWLSINFTSASAKKELLRAQSSDFCPKIFFENSGNVLPKTDKIDQQIRFRIILTSYTYIGGTYRMLIALTEKAPDNVVLLYDPHDVFFAKTIPIPNRRNLALAAKTDTHDLALAYISEVPNMPDEPELRANGMLYLYYVKCFLVARVKGLEAGIEASRNFFKLFDERTKQLGFSNYVACQFMAESLVKLKKTDNGNVLTPKRASEIIQAVDYLYNRQIFEDLRSKDFDTDLATYLRPLVNKYISQFEIHERQLQK